MVLDCVHNRWFWIVFSSVSLQCLFRMPPYLDDSPKITSIIDGARVGDASSGILRQSDEFCSFGWITFRKRFRKRLITFKYFTRSHSCGISYLTVRPVYGLNLVQSAVGTRLGNDVTQNSYLSCKLHGSHVASPPVQLIKLLVWRQWARDDLN